MTVQEEQVQVHEARWLPFVGSNGLSPDALAAGGEHAVADALAGRRALDALAKRHSAIEADGRLSASGKSEARAAALLECYRALATTFGERARALAPRIVRARASLGADRKLNPNDLGVDPRDAFLLGDILQRVALVRTEILRLADRPDGQPLAAVLRAGFDSETPDVILAFAVDTLPPFLRARVEARALVDVDALRRKFLIRKNPEGFAELETLEELGRRCLGDASQGAGQLERIGLSPEGRESLRIALAPLRRALDVADSA